MKWTNETLDNFYFGSIGDLDNAKPTIFFKKNLRLQSVTMVA
jgi:hypothetical protein